MDLKFHTYSDEMLTVKQTYLRTQDVCYYYIVNNEGRGVGIENLNNNELVCYCSESVVAEFEARKQGSYAHKILARANELVSLYKQYTKTTYSKYDAAKEFFMAEEELKKLNDEYGSRSEMLREILNPILSKHIEEVEKTVKERVEKDKKFASKTELEQKVQVCDEFIAKEKEQENTANQPGM